MSYKLSQAVLLERRCRRERRLARNSQTKPSHRRVKLTLSDLTIKKLTHWSNEFGESPSSIVEQALRSLPIVIIVLEQFQADNTPEKGTGKMMVTSSKIQELFPKEWEVSSLVGFDEKKAIYLNLSTQAITILDGLTALLKSTRSEVLEQALSFGAVETAIRKKLNSFS